MSSKSRKTSEPHRLWLNLVNKIDLRSDKSVALSNVSILYIRKNIKISYKSNKFKTSSTTWSKKFHLPYASHSVWDFQDYFE